MTLKTSSARSPWPTSFGDAWRTIVPGVQDRPRSGAPGAHPADRLAALPNRRHGLVERGRSITDRSCDRRGGRDERPASAFDWRRTTASPYRSRTYRRRAGSLSRPVASNSLWRQALASTRNRSTRSTFMYGGRGDTRAASRAAWAASSDSKARTFNVLPEPSVIHSADTNPGAFRTRGTTRSSTMLALASIWWASPNSRITTANTARSSVLGAFRVLSSGGRACLFDVSDTCMK